jgi:hypothetical protein
MLRRYHLFIVCLKMNVFFSAGIILQMLGVMYYTRKYDSQNMGAEAVSLASQEVSQQIVIPSIVVMVIVGLGFYALGWFGSKRCSYWLMSSFLVLIAANAGALCYALYMVTNDSKYRITIIWLTAFGEPSLYLPPTTHSTD